MPRAKRVKEQQAEIRKAMNDMNTEYVDAHWGRYLELERLEHQEYVDREMPNFNRFYEKHIKGKSVDDIEPEAWEFYSDWHKDIFGYRPKLYAR